MHVWYCIIILGTNLISQNEYNSAGFFERTRSDCQELELKQRVMIFYTGSYNEENSPALNPKGDGIGIYSIDFESGDVMVHGYQKQRNPSYVCISPDNKYLFAVEELPEEKNASVFSYRISNNGMLSLIDSKNISGGYACHLAICSGRLIIANYMSGNAIGFEIKKSGHLSEQQQLIQNYGNGPNELRQESPHMHMVYPWEANNIFIVDLSLDIAQGYSFNKVIGEWNIVDAFRLSIDKGSGARHMVMNDSNSLAFVLGELTGEIFVFEKKEIGFVKKQKCNFIVDEYQGTPSGAAIKLHPNGNFLYATDRATNMIAIFKLDKSTNSLSLVGFENTLGKSPRDFEIDPTGNWLIVANQDSNNIVVFKINKENGLLTKQGSVRVNTPVNICFQHYN